MLEERDGVVSVWLGAMADESDFDAYLAERYASDGAISQFAADLGVGFYDHDFLEAAWHAAPQPVMELLAGHSWAESFSDTVAGVADSQRLEAVNAVVLLYDHAYDPMQWPSDAPLRALGVFTLERDPGPASPTRRTDDHRMRVCAVALDETSGASCARGGEVKLWDVETGGCRQTLPDVQGDWLRHIALLTGKRALVVGDEVLILEWSTGETRTINLGSHQGYAIYAAAVGQDEMLAATGAADRSLVIWDLSTSTRLRSIPGADGAIYCVGFLPDGRLIATEETGHVRCWDPGTGRLLWTGTGHLDADAPPNVCVSQLAGTTTGNVVTAARSRIVHWDTDTGVPRRVLSGHRGAIEALVVPRTGNVCVSAGEDCTVRVWDLDQGAARHVLEAHTDRVLCLAVAGDGALAFSGGRDGLIVAWDVVEGCELARFRWAPETRPQVEPWRDDPYAIAAIAVSAQGDRLIVGEFSGRVQLVEYFERQLKPLPR